MKKSFKHLFFALCVIALASCGSSKKIAYLQNIDVIDLAASQGLYDAHIMPKDILTITVFSSDRETAAPYNQTVSNTLSSSNQLSSGSSLLQTYLVDNNGDIIFPEVGKIHVQGLTKSECESTILDKIRDSFNASKPPIVTVKMSSYRVTVLGEVARPGVIPVSTEKMSVLEAIAQAGDLTIYGKRDNVLLIREDATGKKTSYRFDLNDAQIINSPLYYLQQNDIIYVEPNKVKAKNSTIGQSTTIWFSVISILTSLASLVINIVRN